MQYLVDTLKNFHQEGGLWILRLYEMISLGSLNNLMQLIFIILALRARQITKRYDRESMLVEIPFDSRLNFPAVQTEIKRAVILNAGFI